LARKSGGPAVSSKRKNVVVARGSCNEVVRGYFSLHDWESSIHVTSTADFLVYIWARNVETFNGVIEVYTPPSQFRTPGSTGPRDGLAMDVPAQTGMNLGCIGGGARETIDIQSANNRITVFVTVVTCEGAKVNITRTSAPSRPQ